MWATTRTVKTSDAHSRIHAQPAGAADPGGRVRAGTQGGASVSAASIRIAGLMRRFRRNRLGGAVGWGVCGALAGRFAALTSAVLLARLLGPARYGEYALVLSTVMMVSSVATTGVGAAASKYLADLRGSAPELRATGLAAVALIAFAFSSVAGVALYWTAPGLAARHFGRPEMAVPLVVGAVALFFSIVQGAAQGALNGLERFRGVALLNTAAAVALACALPAFAYLGGTVAAVAAWSVVTAISACCAGLMVLRSAVRMGTVSKPRLWRELKRFSATGAPIALSALVMAPVNWLAMSLLARTPAGLEEVGRFNAAYQWYIGLAFIPSVIASATLPLLSRSRSARDGRGFAAIVRDGVLLNMLVAFASAALVWVLADAIMGMYGPQYRESASLLRWLAVASAANGLNAAIGQVMTASNQLWFGVFVNLLWSAVFLGWVAARVSATGALAIAQGLVAAYVVHTLIHLAFLRRHLRDAGGLHGRRHGVL